MSSLGFTSKEQRNLGLLVHLMTSNPKILYAPAGSEADRVILKVREPARPGLRRRCSLGPQLEQLGGGVQPWPSSSDGALQATEQWAGSREGRVGAAAGTV